MYEIILNLDRWFRKYDLKIVFFSFTGLDLFFSSRQQNHFSSFRREHYGEYFCEIILNLSLWFRKRCRLKEMFTRNGRSRTQTR